MRVLLFRMLCDTGGVSSSMLLLGRQMALRGIECEYWFCRPSDRLPEFMATGRATLGQMSALAPRLARGDFDVVQMTASDPGAELIAQMARQLGGRTRVVVTARGALADIWNHENCFAYTAISKGMAAVNQPYTDLEIEVVRNAIDLDRFSPPQVDGARATAPIVAFVGRTTSNEKDFPRFTRIARRLAERGVRVWIADPHKASWSSFEGQPVEQVAVERWEPVPHGQIADFYRAVAASGGVVLMTSKTEGFGNVAPEAAACGARVAAPDVMGLREAVVHNVTGRLYAADASDDDVAGMLHEWLGQPHDIRACSEAARAEFSPSVMMDGYARIYERGEQRRIGTRPPPEPFREREVLAAHLIKQRRWRANFAWGSAVDLANTGYAALARSALRLALRTAPKEFLKKARIRELVVMLRRMLFRPSPAGLATGLSS